MRYQHVQRIWKSPFYVNFKKHYCPSCNEILHKIKMSKIVNRRSEEAKNFDFSTMDGYMVGNVKFIWNELQCPNCKRTVSIDKMKQIEKEKMAKLKEQKSLRQQ